MAHSISGSGQGFGLSFRGGEGQRSEAVASCCTGFRCLDGGTAGAATRGSRRLIAASLHLLSKLFLASPLQREDSRTKISNKTTHQPPPTVQECRTLQVQCVPNQEDQACAKNREPSNSNHMVGGERARVASAPSLVAVSSIAFARNSTRGTRCTSP